MLSYVKKVNLPAIRIITAQYKSVKLQKHLCVNVYFFGIWSHSLFSYQRKAMSVTIKC